MPPQQPPEGGEPMAETVRYVHANGGNTNLKVHRWLEQIVDTLTDNAKPNAAWDMLKMLRVVRYSLEYGVPPSTRMSGFPLAYYPYLADPRLSRVAAASGMTLIRDEAWHLDLDWFGPAGTNWWPGDVTDGRAWQKEVARGFTHWLETAFGLGLSDPDPSSWTWASDKLANEWDDLRRQARPNGALGPLAIEWRAATSETRMEVRIQANGELQINTGRPLAMIQLK